VRPHARASVRDVVREQQNGASRGARGEQNCRFSMIRIRRITANTPHTPHTSHSPACLFNTKTLQKLRLPPLAVRDVRGEQQHGRGAVFIRHVVPPHAVGVRQNMSTRGVLDETHIGKHVREPQIFWQVSQHLSREVGVTQETPVRVHVA